MEETLLLNVPRALYNLAPSVFTCLAFSKRLISTLRSFKSESETNNISETGEGY